MRNRVLRGLFCVAATLSLLTVSISARALPAQTGVAAWLQTAEHTAFLKGYKDGSFQPNGKLTRAEAARMFYRLLKNQDVEPKTKFRDVPEGIWYEKAVNTLYALGIMKGGGGRLFYPDRPITRAEFVSLAMRFATPPVITKTRFSDVEKSDWYYEAVYGAVQYGWINGYKDGSFHPDDTITRAEVAVIVNRMLGRSADGSFIDAHTSSLRGFNDVDEKTCWAYYNICEATNEHGFQMTSSGERWTEIR